MHGIWRHHHLWMRLWMHHRVHLLLLCLWWWRWQWWTTAWPTAQSGRHGRLGRRHQLRLGLLGRPLLGAHGIVVIVISSTGIIRLLQLLIRTCIDIVSIASRSFRCLLHLFSGNLGGHGTVVQIDAVDNDSHEGRRLLVMMPVGRVVVVPLVVMVMSIAVSVSMSIRIFGLLLLFSVAIVVTIAAHTVVSASLPWTAGLLLTAAAGTCGLVGVTSIVVGVVGIVAPPPVPLLSGIGTSGCGVIPCHWLCLLVFVAWRNIFALPRRAKSLSTVTL